MSITRNILDTLSNVIGTLTVPDGTSEGDIAALLAQYSTPFVAPTIPIVGSYVASATANVTTSSATSSVIPSMLVTPAKGTYAVFFSGSINTAGASASGEFGIFVGGSLLPETNRPISCSLTLLGGLVTISLNTIGVGTYTGTQVTVDGNTQIDVRFRSTNGGTIGFTERTMILIKVA